MKDRTLLTDLERQLHGRLRIDLPRVASGNDSLYFHNSDHNPLGFHESRLSKRGTEAYRLACQVQEVRARLGEPPVCAASLLIEAVERHADQGNEHRLGPKRLAAQLLADLEERGFLEC